MLFSLFEHLSRDKLPFMQRLDMLHIRQHEQFWIIFYELAYVDITTEGMDHLGIAMQYTQGNARLLLPAAHMTYGLKHGIWLMCQSLEESVP